MNCEHWSTTWQRFSAETVWCHSLICGLLVFFLSQKSISSMGSYGDWLEDLHFQCGLQFFLLVLCRLWYIESDLHRPTRQFPLCFSISVGMPQFFDMASRITDSCCSDWCSYSKRWFWLFHSVPQSSFIICLFSGTFLQRGTIKGKWPCGWCFFYSYIIHSGI